MTKEQIRSFVLRYLETLQCSILESSPFHVTVKLSPEADKDLTQRSYYWNFVERTGAPPETMTMTFVFDPEKWQNAKKDTAKTPAPDQSILGRYFSAFPAGRGVIQEEVVMGSRKLEQIFASVKSRGKFTCQFEIPGPGVSRGKKYAAWLGINFKVEYTCDMQRDEIVSLGICLHDGEIREPFHPFLAEKKLTATLPQGAAIAPWKLTLQNALERLESHIIGKIKSTDHRWAEQAMERLRDELERIESYYGELLDSVERDKALPILRQKHNRMEEIRWQYQPRIQVRTINGGIFYLSPGS